jgi:hypothetical protein
MQAELLKIWSSAGKTVVFAAHQSMGLPTSRIVCRNGHAAGCIKAVFDVPFPRPRNLSPKRATEFLALTDRVWALIEEETARMRDLRGHEPRLRPSECGKKPMSSLSFYIAAPVASRTRCAGAAASFASAMGILDRHGSRGPHPLGNGVASRPHIAAIPADRARSRSVVELLVSGS